MGLSWSRSNVATQDGKEDVIFISKESVEEWKRRYHLLEKRNNLLKSQVAYWTRKHIQYHDNEQENEHSEPTLLEHDNVLSVKKIQFMRKRITLLESQLRKKTLKIKGMFSTIKRLKIKSASQKLSYAKLREKHRSKETTLKTLLDGREEENKVIASRGSPHLPQTSFSETTLKER